MTITIDGGILAGGRSSRMGGEDKGLKPVNGAPMVQHVADALRPHVNTLWVNCAPRQRGYAPFADRVCHDLLAGQPGPLAGIHSLLCATTADYLLISPCDTPRLSEVYVQRMLSHLRKHLAEGKTDVVLGAKASGRFHCLHLCLPRSARAQLETFFARGQQKVFDWLNTQAIDWIDFTDRAELFDNINNPQQLDALPSDI